MDTVASNKRIREILTEIEQKKLIPDPGFQRRLVWAQKHKLEFIKTILEGLPFPEIYTAAGDVNIDTAEGHTLIVDGQQRITTIYEYFNNSENLILPNNFTKYSDLSDEKKRAFLEYKVVIRDLGNLKKPEVINIFERINSTAYSLNSIEISNARYDNAFKELAETISANQFWNDYKVFSINEVKRMLDIKFILTFMCTTIGNYFTREKSLEDFLIRYNDSFKNKERIEKELINTISYVSELGLPQSCRCWKIADLFTLLVEVHRILYKEMKTIDQKNTHDRLISFYEAVDIHKNHSDIQRKLNLNSEIKKHSFSHNDLSAYHNAALQGSNDRSNRITRGYIVNKVISS